MLGNLLPPWHQFLDQKIRGAHFSLGIVAGERFAIEFTPSTFPQRHFAGDRFPQRHVAGERVGMLLGKASNVAGESIKDMNYNYFIWCRKQTTLQWSTMKHIKITFVASLNRQGLTIVMLQVCNEEQYSSLVIYRRGTLVFQYDQSTFEA
ncbi:hypothetical protein Tco_0377656 [Tanacetum coccineum]